jgi:WhiB family redox-sensing transcriptional regulator
MTQPDRTNAPEPGLCDQPTRVKIPKTHWSGGDGWRDEALCLQTDPELFFPGKGGSCEPAKRICRGCSVRAECLSHALEHGENDGVWGGTSPRQRRALAQYRHIHPEHARGGRETLRSGRAA